MRPLCRLSLVALLGLGAVAFASPARAIEVAGPAAPPVDEPPPSPRPDPVVAVAVDRPLPRPPRTDYVPILVASIGGAFLAADIGFGIHDTARVGQHRIPARGPAIAEASVAAPQVLLLNTLLGVLSASGGDGKEPALVAVALGAGASNALFMHGVWAASTPTAPPYVLYGLSAAVGFDTAFTLSAVARAGAGHFSNRAMGITQMVLATPQIAVGAYTALQDPAHAGAWAGLTAWSGALFLHGLVSTIVAGSDTPDLLPPPPPPPPPPVPERPPLLVPASIHIAPVPFAGGAGIGVSGRWM